MTDGRDPRPYFGAAAFVSIASLTTLGLGPHRFVEWSNARTLVLLLLAVGGGAVAAMNPVPLRRRAASELCLLAAFMWVLLVSALGPRPPMQTLVAASLLGTVNLGLAAGRRWPGSTLLTLLALASVLSLGVAAAAGPWTDFDPRWAGFTEEPNHLAAVAAVAVVVGVATLRTQPIGWLAASLGALVLFETNAAFPTFAVGVGLVVLERHRLPTFWARGALVAVGAAIGTVAAIVVAVPADLLPGDGSHLKTLNDRTGIWSFLAEAIAERPILGRGTWSVHDLTTLGTFDERVHWAPTHAHNAVLELAVAGGLPAGALLVAAFAAFALQNRPAAQQPAAALVATIALMSVTEPLLREPTFPLLVLAAAFAAATRTDPAHRLADEPDTDIPTTNGQ